jgi:hypothetical protein
MFSFPQQQVYLDVVSTVRTLRPWHQTKWKTVCSRSSLESDSWRSDKIL